MPIQFQCNSCGKVLSVSDQYAGKQGSCPACKAVMVVPMSSAPANPPGQTPPAGNPYAQTPGQASGGAYSNPYSSPATQPTKQTSRGGKYQPRTANFDEIFSAAWEAWKANLGILIGVMLVTGVISWVINMISEFAVVNAGDFAVVAILGMNFLSFLVTTFLGIGQARIYLDVARGKPGQFEKLFSGGDMFLPVLAASLIASIAFGFGLLLLVIPGLILMLLFWGYHLVLIDRKVGIMESFTEAYKFCSINIGTSFVVGLVSFLIIIAGILAFCVGILFAAPLAVMLYVVSYLKMTNQI